MPSRVLLFEGQADSRTYKDVPCPPHFDAFHPHQGPLSIIMTYNATNATMQAVVWQGTPYSMAVANVSMPTIMNETDVIVRVSSSAICGTDLHTYHGYYGSAEVPWIMGHEAIGYIQSVGDSVHVLHEGAYVIIPDSVDTGHLELAPAAGPAFGLGDDYGEDMGGCQSMSSDALRQLAENITDQSSSRVRPRAVCR